MGEGEEGGQRKRSEREGRRKRLGGFTPRARQCEKKVEQKASVRKTEVVVRGGRGREEEAAVRGKYEGQELG